MIFKAEVNPRDHKGYYEMICHLQTECLRRHGTGFDVTKFAMGQLHPFGDMCWFEAHVDDADIHKKPAMETMKQHLDRRSNAHKIGQKVTDIHIDYATLLDAIRMDRMGLFSDSRKPSEVINIHIASLGTFNIESKDSSLEDMKDNVTKALLCAINDVYARH